MSIETFSSVDVCGRSGIVMGSLCCSVFASTPIPDNKNQQLTTTVIMININIIMIISRTKRRSGEEEEEEEEEEELDLATFLTSADPQIVAIKI
tara:strand:- start:81 stop:362 length:282 start_codon:yes stop_codon:yes gene_type:complete